ncbi:hypothetical protein GALMADRAFT_1192276 [Galerina marginata CBS 339.88]|uniref:Granulins domain-containing protein n=1 Tax=Galerina marginata (strain CBS 339.88) TaxID=685588 RepID=A0A067TAU7_GALM3|nr:hypothetical protein GALMADRAFT_1192276 [Galerina marginata CBS 339.88]
MNKLFVPLAFILAAVQAQAKFIPVGGTCTNFAGPLPTPCIPGSVCCYVYPDLGLCTKGRKCPSGFVPEGGLCDGIAGPSQLPCFPGTTCCNISPDNSQCLAECKLAN